MSAAFEYADGAAPSGGSPAQRKRAASPKAGWGHQNLFSIRCFAIMTATISRSSPEHHDGGEKASSPGSHLENGSGKHSPGSDVSKGEMSDGHTSDASTSNTGRPDSSSSGSNDSKSDSSDAGAASAGRSSTDRQDDDTGFDTPLPKVDVTRLLRRARDGSDTAREELFRLTYDELRSMAERELRKRHSGGTLSVTSVVNRAYLRLVDDEEGRISTYANRLHFFGTAARAMRSAIIDYARYKTRQKRGGDHADLALEDVLSPEADGRPLETLLTVESALQRLEAMDQDLARVVELIFFGGMLQREVAELEDVDVRTVQRRWRKAKLILRDFLSNDA